MNRPEAPGYARLLASGELARRLGKARDRLASCSLCPRQCQVDRLTGKTGYCRTGALARVSSYAPHFGEESPLVGSGGSGTIFFTSCNLGCVYCQNYEISHLGLGDEVTEQELATIMLSLQRQGCHNINLVTPSHVVPQTLAALNLAARQGLTLPVVYNTSGYDAPDTLRLLDGVVDIYMPDFKFWKKETARRLSGAPDYPEAARAAILEMHRQVGDLVIDAQGVARRGLLMRHLVMPGQLDETEAILGFLAREVSAATYTNLMDQYHPCGRAHEFPDIDHPLSTEEYHAALAMAKKAGLTRLDKRDWTNMLKRLFEN